MRECRVEDERVVLYCGDDQRTSFMNSKSNFVSESSDDRFYVVSGGILARKEECGEQFLPTMKLLCHGASNGRFSSSSSTVKPHNECCDFNDEADPVIDLLEDSNPGVFVASRYVELMTRVVEGARRCSVSQDLESFLHRLIQGQFASFA